MNKHNRLLVVLDDVFGLGNKINSQLRKVNQDFDERTNEIRLPDQISVPWEG